MPAFAENAVLVSRKAAKIAKKELTAELTQTIQRVFRGERFWLAFINFATNLYSLTDSLIIREIRKTETAFLDIMLYNAIFIPPGHDKLPENIIQHPEISKYIRDFGNREGDLCFVAEINGELTGAVWSRLFDENNKAYGFVDSGTPELCMAVYEKFRKKGIGTLLLKTIINALTDAGYKQISLSVDIINYAYGLYKKAGFKDYQQVNDSMTMVMEL